MIETTTKEEFRIMKNFSHSDLSDFKSFTQNGYHPYKDFSRELCLGDLVSKVIFNTENFTSTDKQSLDAREKFLLDTFFDKICKDFICLFSWSCLPHVYTWRDRDTKVLCKSLIDIRWVNNTIVIFKTTSAKNLPDFLKAADNNDYDRQAAFEKDGFDINHKANCSVLFIILSKVYPFKLMTYQATPEVIKRGREKYKALLMDINNQAYIPSHWPNDFNKDYPF